MAKAKEKKVELRDVVRAQLAQLIMADRGLGEIVRTKEGLVVQEVNDKGEAVHLVVRVIQKKELTGQGDVVETIVAEADEADEAEDVAEDVADIE